MSDSELTNTVIIDTFECDIISKKLAAINNKVRFSILEILRDNSKEPLYSREINSILLNKYNISITVQMLGQHLKQLVESELIREVTVKKEVVNKVGQRNVNGYSLKDNAFEDLFLEISFFSDEILTFFDLHKINLGLEDGYCIITIFNGPDKGKTFKVHKDESILIGRKSNFTDEDFELPTILLDNEYETVSNVSKPHLKVFNKEDKWYVIDGGSSNGTFIKDIEIPINKAVEVKNNSFIKLSRGNGGVVIHVSY